MSPDEPRTASDDAVLDELRAIAELAGREPVTWETPPADLWQRISTGAAEAAADESEPGGGAAVTSIVSARERRHTTPWWTLGAAAAAAFLAVGAVVVWALRGEGSAVVAEVPLEPLGESGEGHAELVERGDGFELRVATNSVSADAGNFVEVWVINTDVTEMISLGPLRRDGRYELPDGLDPAAFPIVDLSIEPFDGVPTHSGNSVLRGELSF